MCVRKFLCQWLWHSLMKLCTKNYENLSIFVKVTAKKSMPPFLCGHSVYWEFEINAFVTLLQWLNAIWWFTISPSIRVVTAVPVAEAVNQWFNKCSFTTFSYCRDPCEFLVAPGRAFGQNLTRSSEKIAPCSRGHSSLQAWQHMMSKGVCFYLLYK